MSPSSLLSDCTRDGTAPREYDVDGGEFKTPQPLFKHARRLGR
jgi:hypothetical protein